jgi:pantetheine-phosphate adenylyltransferase
MGGAAIYPGSFDPVTLGHRDVIVRAAALFDHLIVAVVGNPLKQALFPLSERVALLEQEVAGIGPARLEVIGFEGLLVDLCRERGIPVLVKGLRSVSDLDPELHMAQMNRHIGAVETVFLGTAPEHSHLSSTLVREVARFGGRLDGSVSPAVEAALRARSS